jgi:peptidoglycan hydrolase-like protein with peptidoglycan-binding domain
MANILPIVAIGAAAVLLSKKKKKKKSGSYSDFDYENFVVPPTPPPANATKTSGPSAGTASKETWKQRQTALAFVAGMKVCNCHPGNIDGMYGPATINAIIAFQVCAGIGVDGKWGPQTQNAMSKMLAEIASGNVTVKKPSS